MLELRGGALSPPGQPQPCLSPLPSSCPSHHPHLNLTYVPRSPTSTLILTLEPNLDRSPPASHLHPHLHLGASPPTSSLAGVANRLDDLTTAFDGSRYHAQATPTLTLSLTLTLTLTLTRCLMLPRAGETRSRPPPRPLHDPANPNPDPTLTPTPTPTPTPTLTLTPNRRHDPS